MADEKPTTREDTGPTDEQLDEAIEFLEMVLEIGAPQNEWEQSAVQRLHDMVVRMRESPKNPS